MLLLQSKCTKDLTHCTALQKPGLILVKASKKPALLQQLYLSSTYLCHELAFRQWLLNKPISPPHNNPHLKWMIGRQKKCGHFHTYTILYPWQDVYVYIYHIFIYSIVCASNNYYTFMQMNGLSRTQKTASIDASLCWGPEKEDLCRPVRYGNTNHTWTWTNAKTSFTSITLLLVSSLLKCRSANNCHMSIASIM